MVGVSAPTEIATSSAAGTTVANKIDNKQLEQLMVEPP
jgi:hypothetical protein